MGSRLKWWDLQLRLKWWDLQLASAHASETNLHEHAAQAQKGQAQVTRQLRADGAGQQGC